MIRQVSVYDYYPEVIEDEPEISPVIPEEKPKKKKSDLYGSAAPPTDF